MFGYSGIVTAPTSADIEHGEVGSLYYCRVSMRPFNPSASVELHCPFRALAWAMRSPVFDYRVAQMFGNLESRDGPWYSRRPERFSGSLSLRWPQVTDIPKDIEVTGRISWWPPHATIIWESHGFYQKLSFRPVTGAPCNWKEIPFENELFTDEIKSRFHRYLDPATVTSISPCPPKPDDQPIKIPVTEPKNDPPVTHLTNDPPNSQLGTASQQSSRPPSEVTSEDWHGRWNWSDQNDDDDDVWGSGYSGHWNHWHGDYNDWEQRGDTEPTSTSGARDAEQESWAPNTWWARPVFWSPADWGPLEEEERKSVTETEVSTIQPDIEAISSQPILKSAALVETPQGQRHAVPAAAQVTESPIRAPSTPPPVYICPAVKVTETTQTVRTRSLEPLDTTADHREDSSSPASFDGLLQLQLMAISGAPLTREDRLARQVIANRLSLPPDVYNYLVFGEQIPATAAPAITDTAGSPSP